MANGDLSILVINAGSSSMKFALFGMAQLHPAARGLLTWQGSPRLGTITLVPFKGETICRELGEVHSSQGVAAFVAMLREAGLMSDLCAIGHRLIHGGADIDGPVLIDDDLKALITSRQALAPLHIPAGLEAIDAAEKAFAQVPHFGVFDTAFFANIKPEAYRYAVPRAWHDDYGVRRYGFHGISHEYCAGRALEMLDRGEGQRLVICHLGQGSSAAAVRGRTAVASTMGMTPLEGLPMGTRSGAIDAGALLHLMRDRGLTVQQVDHALHHESGLLGLSGFSNDYREIEQAAAKGNADCRLALDVFAHRVVTSVGALTAALGGLDALVFTGGIGENAAALRREVCAKLGFLGIDLDVDRNLLSEPDVDIALPSSATRVLVIHTREDLMIARQCRELLMHQA